MKNIWTLIAVFVLMIVCLWAGREIGRAEVQKPATAAAQADTKPCPPGYRCWHLRVK